MMKHSSTRIVIVFALLCGLLEMSGAQGAPEMTIQIPPRNALVCVPLDDPPSDGAPIVDWPTDRIAGEAMLDNSARRCDRGGL